MVMRHASRAHNLISTIVVIWVVAYSLLFIGEIALEKLGVRSGGWGEHHWALMAAIATGIWAVVFTGVVFRKRRAR